MPRGITGHQGREWTPEEIERLRDLWKEGGRTMTEIGLMLLRNRTSVSGKLHRLGILNTGLGYGSGQVNRHPVKRPGEGNGGGKPRNIWRDDVTGRLLPCIAATGPVRIPDLPLGNVEPLRVKLMDLRHSHCRWPIGDPKAADFAFCGLPKQRGSYCKAHVQLAGQPWERRP